MTEKRGTGAEYGQDVLRERAQQNEDQLEKSAKKMSAKKMLGITIAVIVAAGTVGAIFMTSPQTPAAKTNETSVSINESGVPLTASVKSEADQPQVKSLGLEEVTEPVVDDLAKVSEPAEAVVTSTVSPSTEQSDKSKTASDAVQPVKPAVAITAGSIAATDSSAPVTEPVSDPSQLTGMPQPSADVVPAETIATQVQNDVSIPGVGATQPTSAEVIQKENEPASADKNGAVTNAASATSDLTASVTPPSVKAADGVAGQESAVPDKQRGFIPEQFGLTKSDADQFEQRNAPADSTPVQRPVVPDSGYVKNNISITPADLNFTGKSVEVNYGLQEQNTIHVYGSFSAKVYLLPIDKNEKINAYLSDEKGWKTTLLPGNILRIQKTDDKSVSSPATDLFIVAGKRTYSLILQSVDDPEKRTDSLRYQVPDSAKQAKSKVRS